MIAVEKKSVTERVIVAEGGGTGRFETARETVGREGDSDRWIGRRKIRSGREGDSGREKIGDGEGIVGEV